MANITEISFREIPRQSALFLDYLESSPAALQFYQQTPSLQGIENAVKARLGSSIPRNDIASILRRQNESYGCDATTLQSIRELENPNCAAILTGQQVGLFTGPLYTIYKALTAIKLADELKRRGTPAVPIFWMDTEDHDLAEISHHTVLAPDFSVRAIDFREILFKDLPSGPAGSIPFPATISLAVEEYLRFIPDGPWKAEMRSQLAAACTPGTTFAQSFAALLSRILPNTGLILFDPQDAEAKRLIAPVFQEALHNAGEIRSSLLRRNQELEASGFHAQVKVLENSTVLFLMDCGERRALENDAAVFTLKNSAQSFSLEELLTLAAAYPEKFSPNVLLRPIIQDHLFPTAAYVGGSSELAYFAQIETLYRLYGLPMPVIWARDSFTLMGPEVADAMDRLGIAFQDCFRGREFVAEKALRNSNRSTAPASLEELGDKIDRVLMELKPEFQAFEPPLAEALETARRKIAHNIQHLKSQLIRLEGTHASATSNFVERILSHCYPRQTLQERELGIPYFFARHGASVLDDVRSALNVDRFAHRLIRLSS